MNRDQSREKHEKRPLRIALTGSRGIPASYSGFETFYEQLAVRLVERGHHVTVYNRAHHIKSRQTEYRGIRLVRLPSIQSKHLDTLSHTFISILHALFSRNDIIYICIVGNSPLCLLPRLARKKVILNVDGADSEREKWRGFAKTYLRWSEKIACLLADTIIADAKEIQRRYLNLYSKETTFIPYGANIWPRRNEAHNTSVLEEFGLSDDGYFLFVSRLTPENHAHTLIEAFKRANTDLKLVIVGDAPYVNEYKKELEKLCDDERIILTGYQFGDSYRQLSCHCRCFVLPAGIDGTRPVLLDQMGFGNCVVVRDTPVNLEVIGDSGLSFDRNHAIESLTQVLQSIASDPELVEEMRARAIRRIAEKYSWDRVTDQYEDLFYSLIEK
ncbi:glycosyltransferase [Thiohalobacter sp. IOR34]|uniref:glycosyltransferase n=1 Tax=Thiohalobacter sp. IOR34 TaxID=3057176 RepID=UPI0025B0F725|nr:glycosyltransferase [Thiohalobacter sp. IOR34]WJW76292.1 glycosyltransferase [Thiohalobacter sp. IOR34]